MDEWSFFPGKYSNWMKRRKAVKIIKTEYGGESISDKKIPPFRTLETYKDLKVKEVLLVEQTPTVRCYMLIIRYTHVMHAQIRGIPSSEESNYFFGLIKGISDIGEVYIRPETLRDKINELFHPEEIDFPETPEFSSMFYVLSKDRHRASRELKTAVRKLLAHYPDCELEYLGDNCLIRLNRSSLSINNLHQLRKFMGEYLNLT